MLLQTPNDTTLGPALAELLEQVQQRFSGELLSDTDCVNDLVAHVERFRGKCSGPHWSLSQLWPLPRAKTSVNNAMIL